MTGGLARKVAALAAETCGSLLLVAAAYLFFMFLLGLLFPSGTPLKEILNNRLEAPAPSSSGPKRRAPALEATLTRLVRDVGYRRGNSLAWGAARQGMPLYSQDAVQTFDRSTARISFSNRDHLDLGSNSSVVVHRVSTGGREGARRCQVQLQGDAEGNLSDSRRLRLELRAAGHRAAIGPKGAQFKVLRITPESSGLSVFSGEAVLVGKKTMHIPAEHGVTLTKGVWPVTLHPLPQAPALENPELRKSYRLLPPTVRLAWSGTAGEYHFQLSRWPDFSEIMVDARLATPAYSTARLEAGSYYWRVSRLEEGREGRFSTVGRLELKATSTPPRLKVLFPEGEQTAAVCCVSGEIDTGARLFLDGRQVPGTESGRFSQKVRLQPGANLIRVEAVDAAGNASYASRVVYAKGEQRQGEEEALPCESQ